MVYGRAFTRLAGAGCLNTEETRIVAPGEADLALGERVHVLEIISGAGAGRHVVVGAAGASIGRITPADIILADAEVSRSHCRVDIAADGVVLTDLNSTNGTFVNGVAVKGAQRLDTGAVLRIGRNHLRYAWRTRRELLESEQLDRDLDRAYAYIEALLPHPMSEGPIRTEWMYQPSARLGGDAFGYGPLSETLFAFYLVDVSGHGAGAAMHSVAVMNLLRQHALPGVDMSRPSQVLSALNDMFQMEAHGGLYFTIWYGVLDRLTRRLTFGSAGHHPAFLLGRPGDPTPLRTRNGLIGAIPGKAYVEDDVTVPAGSSLYLFSDGVFEIVTKQGLQWALQDFLALVPAAVDEGATECRRLYDEVVEIARPGGLDDDFTLLILRFD
jgi:serine phosphatase RsbU (regulator of sigma subunit)